MFTADTNTGFYRPSNDTLGFVTGGSERMRIDASGNVGIGIGTPFSKLHVLGNITVSSQSLTNQTSVTNAPPALTIIGGVTSTARFAPPDGAQGSVSTIQLWSTFQNTVADNGARYTSRITSGFNGGAWGNEYLSIGVGNNAAANDGASDPVEKIRVMSNGNVGIGTSHPQATLHVEGNIICNRLIGTNLIFSLSLVPLSNYQNSYGVEESIINPTTGTQPFSITPMNQWAQFRFNYVALNKSGLLDSNLINSTDGLIRIPETGWYKFSVDMQLYPAGFPSVWTGSTMSLHRFNSSKSGYTTTMGWPSKCKWIQTNYHGSASTVVKHVGYHYVYLAVNDFVGTWLNITGSGTYGPNNNNIYTTYYAPSLTFELIGL
jgi:hypothetical protein